MSVSLVKRSPFARLGRVYDQARRDQGFKSQAHLDAFFAHYDHTRSCSDCGPGPAVPLDDGMQPTRRECDAALALFMVSWHEGRRAPVLPIG